AGANQTITMPASANLSGTATDDGLPTGSVVTTSWSKVSGPGTVSFGNGASLNTTAAFSAGGDYVLRLTATDSQLTSSDDVSITVTSGGPVFYVDQSGGNDNNSGTSPTSAWQNAPGMTACSGVCGATAIPPGSTVYLDRRDTWLVNGESGLHLKGG